MSISSYKNGGYIITWEIDNYNFLKEETALDSPTFFIETLQTTEWNISVYTRRNYLNIFLERGSDNGPTNVTLSYTISCSCDEDSSIGTRTFRNSYSQLLKSCTLHDDCDISSEKRLVISCHVRDISYVHTVIKCFGFRSVVAVEHRRTNCLIPSFKYCLPNQTLHFSLPSACKTSPPFDIILFISNNDDNSKMVQLDIVKMSNGEVLLYFKLSVIGDEGKIIFSATHRHKFERLQGIIWRFPCSIDDGKLISDGSLFLKCEMLISEGKCMSWISQSNNVPIYQNDQFPGDIGERKEGEKANLRDDLLCLYMECKYPDVELFAEGRMFPTHKAILCARSPVFSAMFERDMREKESNTVMISDVDVGTLDRMLVFMYSEILPDDQEWNSMVKLYIASDKYQILSLKNKCSSFLKDNLSVRNTCEALLLADMHHDVKFESCVEAFIRTKAKLVFQSDEWKSLMECRPDLACSTMHKVLLENI